MSRPNDNLAFGPPGCGLSIATLTIEDETVNRNRNDWTGQSNRSRWCESGQNRPNPLHIACGSYPMPSRRNRQKRPSSSRQFIASASGSFRAISGGNFEGSPLISQEFIIFSQAIKNDPLVNSLKINTNKEATR